MIFEFRLKMVMIPLLKRIFSSKARYKCPFQLSKSEYFSVSTCKYSLNQQNILQSISFEDIRLQKHLKFLCHLFNDVHKDSNNLEKSFGIGYDVLKIIRDLNDELERTKQDIKDVDLLMSDVKNTNDELYKAALSEKESFQYKLDVIHKQLLLLVVPPEAGDDKDIILEISPGVGGQEAMLFAQDMLHMYRQYANFRGWEHELLKYDTTDIGGVRSAHVSINGINAYKTLKYECGVHRVQRVPKTEKAGRMHTSTITVAVLPQPSEIDVIINPNDIEFEFKRSSGAGGQHVNKTESCVRIYHKPSGLVVESQVSRDQHRNRQVALTSLRAQLYERQLTAAIKQETLSRKAQVGTAGRSEKVRTYNFTQDRVTDHRVHVTLHGVQEFLKGEDHFDRLANRIQWWGNEQALNAILDNYSNTS